MDATMMAEYARTKDPRIEAKIMHSLEDVIHATVQRFVEPSHQDFDDLKQECRIMVLRKLREYNPLKGNLRGWSGMNCAFAITKYFESQKPKLVQSVLKHQDNRRPLVKMSYSEREALATEDVTRSLGRKWEDIFPLLNALRGPVYLDDRLTADGSVLVHDTIPDTRSSQAFTMVERFYDLAKLGVEPTQRQLIDTLGGYANQRAKWNYQDLLNSGELVRFSP